MGMWMFNFNSYYKIVSTKNSKLFLFFFKFSEVTILFFYFFLNFILFLNFTKLY